MSKSYLQQKINELVKDKKLELLDKYGIEKNNRMLYSKAIEIARNEQSALIKKIDLKIRKFGYKVSAREIFIDSLKNDKVYIYCNGNHRVNKNHPIVKQFETIDKAYTQAMDKIHLTKDLMAAFEEFKQIMNNI